MILIIIPIPIPIHIHILIDPDKYLILIIDNHINKKIRTLNFYFIFNHQVDIDFVFNHQYNILLL